MSGKTLTTTVPPKPPVQQNWQMAIDSVKSISYSDVVKEKNLNTTYNYLIFQEEGISKTSKLCKDTITLSLKEKNASTIHDASSSLSRWWIKGSITSIYQRNYPTYEKSNITLHL